jgi:hypothetical protein
MDDLTEQEILEAAFEQVLNHPSFKSYTRESLVSCRNFCEMIRQAPHEEVVQLMDSLNEIALATDDHNEASGELLTLIAIGGSLNTTQEEEQPQAELSSIPVTDAELFCDWVVGLSESQREQAYTAAMDALCKHVVRIKPDDSAANLTHHQLNLILYYALSPVEELLEFGNFANENLDEDFSIHEQIPGRLWELFNSRPKEEVDKLLKHWWGGHSSIPHDFFIALEWQRQGYIEIHKGKKYLETVAEFLLHSCEPCYGIEALELGPFLAEELYAGLMEKGPYPYLISHDVEKRAEYLNSLFTAGVLQREPVLAALDSGISNKWEMEFIEDYKLLREKITA